MADSFLEGADQWQQELKKQADSREKEEVKEKRPARDARTKEVVSGPAVVKINKGRKLVAAGTADDVEIAEELEQQDAFSEEDSTTPETPEKK
jgi:small subunit ribosomal protein S2